MTVELEKRYTYIQKFFESLSDEEFVRMMIECGIKSSKKIIVKIYNKWEKRGMLSQNIAYPIGGIYKDINCKREIYFFFSSANRSSRFAINLRELLSCLEDAEVQGDIPELSTEWWNEIGKIYPRFRKEVEKETDDIGPTLQ